PRQSVREQVPYSQKLTSNLEKVFIQFIHVPCPATQPERLTKIQHGPRFCQEIIKKSESFYVFPRKKEKR
ncbi:MAG: hypothetical protein ACYS72_04950, partial [Planctomycetota bacterium]